MAPRRLQLQSLYLEPRKAELLDALAVETRVPKAVLLREAVDDLLIKHKKLRKSRDSSRI
jgi:ribbon-helix-helix protein